MMCVRLVALVIAALFALCCDSHPPTSAAVEARARVLSTDRELKIGDIVDVEVTIATPSDHRVLSLTLPEIESLQVVSQESQPTRRDGSRWHYAERVRLRPRTLGHLEWPAFEVTVEDPAGEQRSVRAAGLEFEVSSIMSDYPDRVEPFGLQSLATVRKPDAVLDAWRVASGVAAVLACVALIAIARRRWLGSSWGSEGRLDSEGLGPGDWAQHAISEAESVAVSDPRAAANAAAHVLRDYLDRRYGTDIRAATTPELRKREPVWYLRSRWSEFVAILRALDEERFPDLPDHRTSESESGARVLAALANAREFIAEGAPRDGARR